MDAIITARFIASNMCNEEDLVDYEGNTVEEKFFSLVKYIIQEESLFGIVDDSCQPEIIDVQIKKED